MKLKIFSVKDNLVGYGQLFTDVNVDVAKRSFTNSLLHYQTDNDFGISPADLNLYCFGTFDSDTGVIHLYNTPALLLDGANVLVSSHNVVSKEVESDD